jgi:hypothetical protein
LSDGSVSIRESFAAIGQGKNLAIASLLRREQYDYDQFPRTLYNVFEEKKYSEKVPSVGESTNIVVITNDNLKFIAEDGGGLGRLRQLFEIYGPKETDDGISFDEAKLYDIFEC